MSRRYFGVLAGLLVCLAASACRSVGDDAASQRDANLLARIDAAQVAAASYILARQQPDGSFRSETYGFMKDGPSLTAHVAYCLFFIPRVGPEARAGFDRSTQYLAGLINPDATVKSDVNLIFPVYTSAEASWSVARTSTAADRLAAQAAWLKYLRSYQLTEANGWSPSDLEYGGWGFALRPPRKAPGQSRGPWDSANLTATLYGIEAMIAAKTPRSDPAYAAVLTFVMRCQNYTDDPAGGDAEFDDGGFFFTPSDPLQNKAGVAGTDRFGRQRMNSYGSMTVDGLRALLCCGLPPEHPRVVAARQWLERNFSVEHNPGTFASSNEDLRDATYYYYCWGLAHALMHTRSRLFPRRQAQTGSVDWPVALAQELLRRQRPDGLWANHYTDAREDDPLVATPFASAALAICRGMIAGEDLMAGSKTTRPERS